MDLHCLLQGWLSYFYIRISRRKKQFSVPDPWQAVIFTRTAFLKWRSAESRDFAMWNWGLRKILPLQYKNDDLQVRLCNMLGVFVSKYTYLNNDLILSLLIICVLLLLFAACFCGIVCKFSNWNGSGGRLTLGNTDLGQQLSSTPIAYLHTHSKTWNSSLFRGFCLERSQWCVFQMMFWYIHVRPTPGRSLQ
jgi:hypothetical protein